MTRTALQRRRVWTQVGFFVLFLVAPPLDLLRVDLTRGHGIFLGQDWTLGIDAFVQGQAGVGEAALNLVLRGFLPLFGGAALFLWIAWRFGRLYCGWLCPHFSVVETINGLMRRARGSPSLSERPPPGARTNRWYWLPVVMAVIGFAFLWALALLTYLLPPFEIYHNLLTGQLTRNQGIFLTAGTLALSVEFLAARHFFCRFACAVGLFQSLAWMGNNRAMVVGFDTRRAAACADCDNACDEACPMRLKPRTIKRKMFTCTQCSECISACIQVQGGEPGQSLLRWVEGDAALPVVTGRPGAGPGGAPPACRRGLVEPPRPAEV
jgi:ferredoxin-type protein NapH